MELITVTKRRGNYDWLHPEKTQIAYEFWNIENTRHGSVVVNDNIDLELPDYLEYTILDFATDLLNEVKSTYLAHGSIKWLTDFVEYLKTHADEQCELGRKHVISVTRRRIDSLKRDFRELEGLLVKLGEPIDDIFDKRLELTKEQKDNFSAGFCPKCGEKNIPDTYEYDGDVSWSAYKCKCGTGWREIFELVEVEKYPYEEE